MIAQPFQQFYSDVANVRKSAAKKAGKPESVLVPVPGTFDGATVDVGLIKYGEHGMHFSIAERHTEEWIYVQNQQAGVDDETVLAFRVCSLTGKWDKYEEILNKFYGKSGDV